LCDLIAGEAGDEDGFVPGGMAVSELDLTRMTMEAFGEETEKGFIGGGIDGRRGDADAKFICEGSGDGIGGCAGLEFDGEANAVGLGTEP
jgi:hypothetical protein